MFVLRTLVWEGTVNEVERVVPDAFSDSATTNRATTEDTETNPSLEQEETERTEPSRFNY
jgi:hypothetical protein